jgi:Ser/Thr protein kinase RdoA (MazF antagonist)
MDVTKQHDVRSIGRHFQIYGEFVSAQPYGSGHINDTYATTYDQGGTSIRYVLQRINHAIFKNPVGLMENIKRTTHHLREKLLAAGSTQITRETLTVIPARDGLPYHRDPEGNYWRMYIFIEGARTYDLIETPEQACEAAKAFGQFQKLLSDLPPPRLTETIPDFHNTPKRFEALEKAIEADAKNRATSAKAEIEFAQKLKPITTKLLELNQAGEIPERITHNDTKLNNVMLDDVTGKGICVIDLDTVMPGLALYDIGDMIRTATNSAKEDERDLSKVKMRMPIFEALVRGYLESAGEFLTKAEKKYLAFSGKLITFEIGIRFLTDYLSGDTYFKIHREGQNLDRCRTQFKLAQSIADQEEAMNKMINELTHSQAPAVAGA